MASGIPDGVVLMKQVCAALCIDPADVFAIDMRLSMEAVPVVVITRRPTPEEIAKIIQALPADGTVKVEERVDLTKKL